MKKVTDGDAEYIKMTETPVSQLVVLLSLPTVLSMLITSVYNMADTYFVSKLSDSAVGAVGIVFSLQSIIQAVGYGLAMGAGSLVSRRLGEKNSAEAAKYASSAFFSAIAFGLLLMGGCLIDLNGLLRLFGSTETILPYAHGYALIILIGAPIMCSSFVLNNTLRAEGKALFSMIGLTAGGFINILLDPLFIFTFKMGVSGAALATVFSQCISFIILLSFYLLKKSLISLSLRNISRRARDYLLIINTGLPTIFRQGLGSLATTLLNVQVKKYGDTAIAAVIIANKVYILLRSIIIGVGQGFQPVAGYNYGAGNKKRVRKAFYVATFLGTVISCISGVVLLVFARQIIGIFRPGDTELIRIGGRMLRFLGVSLPFLGYSTYVNQLFQSLGFVWGATILASCRQGIFFVPLILILPQIVGLDGVLFTQTGADILTFLVSIPFNIYFMKRILNDDGKPKLTEI